MGEDDEASGLERRYVTPSHADVLAELAVLRERQGISPTKIAESAPHIMALPIVDDQLDLRGFNPRDRHLAAYSAIGCVLEHMDNLLWRTILILTLRYDFMYLAITPPQGWDDVSRQSSLTARQPLVQSIVGYEKTQYFVHYDRAYNELANQLLLLERSPCRRATASRAELKEDLGRLQLRQLLGFLTVEARAAIREALLEDLLLRVPTDGQSVRHWNPYSESARGLIVRALDTEYLKVREDRERSYTVRLNTPRPVGNYEGIPLHPAVMRDLLLTRRGLSPIEWFESRREISYRSGDGQIYFDWSGLARSLDLLADILTRAEVVLPSARDLEHEYGPASRPPEKQKTDPTTVPSEDEASAETEGTPEAEAE